MENLSWLIQFFSPIITNLLSFQLFEGGKVEEAALLAAYSPKVRKCTGCTGLVV